jgi:hypothetical protein
MRTEYERIEPTIPPVTEKVMPDSADTFGPSHYSGFIQPWDAMEVWMPPHQFIGYLRGNIIKYSARMDRKGAPLQDAQKALHYAQKLVEVMTRYCGPEGDQCPQGPEREPD